MSALRPCAVAVLALALAESAAAEPVTAFRYAQAANAAASPGAKASPDASRKAPGGVAGFYDPATRAFTPLPKSPQAEPQVFQGEMNLDIDIDYELNLVLRNSDTLNCSLQIAFGNLVDGRFFPNHYVDKIFSIALKGSADQHIPFTYASNGNGEPAVRVNLNCSTKLLEPSLLVFGGDDGTAAHALKNGSNLERLEITL